MGSGMEWSMGGLLRAGMLDFALGWESILHLGLSLSLEDRGRALVHQKKIVLLSCIFVRCKFGWY